MPNHSPLASLALLKILWDEKHHDYIDAFLPLLALLIHRRGIQEIHDLRPLQSDFLAEWGLEIPYHALATIVNRARKRRLLKKSMNIYRPSHHMIRDLAGSVEAQAREHQIHRISATFIEYAQRIHATSLTSEEAESALIAFLRDHDLDMLFAAKRGTLLPEVRVSRQDMYLFASFVKHASTHDKESFELVSDIALGHVIANALAFQDIGYFKGRLRGLSVYFDSPIIFAALELAGEEEHDATKELLHVLHEEKVKCRLFQHNYDEILGILETSMKWLDNLTYYDPSKASKALRHFVEVGARPSDIEELILELPSRLSSLGIEVVESPTPQENLRYQIGEDEFGQLVRNNYLHYPSDERTVLTDIKSIASIYFLRQDRLPRRLTDAKYLFATSNQTLAATARQYEELWGKKDFFIPACVTDVFLGTLAWLQSPTLAQGINRARLIADCQSLLEPSGKLLERYMSAVQLLHERGQITAEEYLLLRTSRVARSLLESKTLGDPDNFSQRTPEEILANLRAQVRLEEQELAKSREQELLEDLKQIRNREDQERVARQQLEAKMGRVIGRLARWAAAAVYVILIPVGVGVALLVSLPKLQELHPYLGLIAPVASVLLILGSLLLPVFNFWKWSSRLEKQIRSALERLIT